MTSYPVCEIIILRLDTIRGLCDKFGPKKENRNRICIVLTVEFDTASVMEIVN